MGDERGGGTVRGLAIVVLAASALALWCAPARAHVHSVRTEQLPGRLGTLELRVPHGCGDSATTRIDVQIAEGVTDVKPLVVPLLSMGAMGALAAVTLLLIRHRR
jgi:uncharacterized protein YcnI